jgi:hypothetical protein
MDNSFQNLIKDWPHLVVYFDSKVHICNLGNKLNMKILKISFWKIKVTGKTSRQMLDINLEQSGSYKDDKISKTKIEKKLTV